jgi:putative FmdB family regulatory protein
MVESSDRGTFSGKMAGLESRNHEIRPHYSRTFGPRFWIVIMPIYEYRCQACGHELEKLQKMTDAPLTDCPVCNKAALVKKISAAGFRLKGGGWYETDFKKDGKKNLADGGGAGTSGGSDGGSSSDTGSKADKASSSDSTS